MTTLIKAHGSENQFFLLDQTTLTTSLTDAELTQLAIRLCSPITGVDNGADGLLVINDAPGTDCAGQMRVINADGSEAKMCGNGLRTVSRYLAEKTGQTAFKVATLEANLPVHQAPNLAENVPAFSVQIAPISLAAADLPFHYQDLTTMVDEPVPEFIPGQTFTAIAVPNPHLISFVDHIDAAQLGRLGERLNAKNPYFPEGVNVSFAEIQDTNTLFVQTYERGVGFTNACGTGMSATSLAFARLHPDHFAAQQDITVFNPGGLVKTHVTLAQSAAASQIQLIGNATFTATLTLAEADLHQANLQNVTLTLTGEEAAYQKFVAAVTA